MLSLRILGFKRCVKRGAGLNDNLCPGQVAVKCYGGVTPPLLGEPRRKRFSSLMKRRRSPRRPF